MLMPKRVKYRKQQRGRTKGMAQRGNSVAFGDFGLKATGRGRHRCLHSGLRLGR